MIALVAACKVNSGAEDTSTRGHAVAGATCAEGKDCASGICTLEGFCGQIDCSDARPCPSGWMCQSYSSFLSNGWSCEPACDACPVGTKCDGGRCKRPPAVVTITGGPIHANQPVSFDLAIDAGARGPYTTSWSIANPDSSDSMPIATGTGTHVAVTLPEAVQYRMLVTLKGGGLKDEAVSIQLPVCAEQGAACRYAGGCCSGECVIDRYFVYEDDFGKAYCAPACPATCQAGYSCHDFTQYAGSGYPGGQHCLPDPPVVTIDVSPAAPKANQPVTLTGHATSAAGLKIIGWYWYVDGSGLEASKEPTLTLNPTKAEFHQVWLHVFDESQQIAKQPIGVNITE